MKQVLIIESSPRGAESASRQLTNKLKERLATQYPEVKFVERDLAKDPLPHLDYRTVKAIFTRDQAEAESLKDALDLSNQVTEEVLSSDLLVIASPLWNFGLPSSLKSRRRFCSAGKKPGVIELTRTLRGAHSRARNCERFNTAALAAE